MIKNFNECVWFLSTRLGLTQFHQGEEGLSHSWQKIPRRSTSGLRKEEGSLLRVAWGQLADMSSGSGRGLAAPTLLEDAVAYGKAVYSQAIQQPARPSSQGTASLPTWLPAGPRFLPPFSLGPAVPAASHIPMPTPLTAPTSPAPILSLTTFDAGSDYFSRRHQASHKTQTPGTSLVGLIRIDLPMRSLWIQSLVGGAIFHMPRDK